MEHYYKLCEQVASATKDFEPNGFAEWRRKASEDDTKFADDAVKRLQKLVHDVAIAILKKAHGDKYLEASVANDQIMIKAYGRQLEAKKKGEENDIDVYFDLLELKEIIEHKSNWPLFKDVFDIEMPGDKGHAKNLRWLVELNTARRVSAHPAGNRNYKPEDVAFLRWLDGELRARAGAQA